jgi:hypothetical protein
VGDDGRCTGTIADGITSALGCLPDHLCSQVLGGILQVDFFGDGDTIVTDSPVGIGVDGDIPRRISRCEVWPGSTTTSRIHSASWKAAISTPLKERCSVPSNETIAGR